MWLCGEETKKQIHRRRVGMCVKEKKQEGKKKKKKEDRDNSRK